MVFGLSLPECSSNKHVPSGHDQQSRSNSPRRTRPALTGINPVHLGEQNGRLRIGLSLTVQLPHLLVISIRVAEPSHMPLVPPPASL